MALLPLPEATQREVSASSPLMAKGEPLAQTSKRPPKKSGKKLPGATKKLVEEKLLPGQRVTAKELAPLIEVSQQGIRNRRDAKKLGDWGLRSVGCKPELFERI